jgi:hypothetical protein
MRVALVLALTAVAAPAAAQEPEAAERAARAESILAREEGRGRPFGPGFRTGRKAILAAASEEQLAEVERRGHGLLPGRVLGDGPRNLVLTPIAPCRIIDTRIAGGTLAAGAARDFFVAGSTGFESQGGAAGGCGVPLGDTAAVVINFVAVAPAGPGNLRAWPFGAAMPNASIVNYAAVGGLNIANGLVVPLCRADVVTCTHDLTVRADASAAHLVADVLGYFVEERRSIVRQAEASSGGSPVPTTCANTGGVSVTVSVDTPGYLTLRGTASIEMLHFNGQDDEVKAFIGTTPTDCSSTTPSTSRIPAALPSFLAAPGMWVELNPVRVLQFVGPGSSTYYLNFQNTGVGAGNDRFRLGHLEAVFHPYH